MASAVGIKVEEHFHSAEQQRETVKLGMWTFLLTELLLFSGMFVSALIIRVLHPQLGNSGRAASEVLDRRKQYSSADPVELRNERGH